jgi:hypothetical protein
VPDPAQRRSSVDGGVIWPRVPRGVYTIRGRHPHTRFASFVDTCVPGRVVNANPPWGLHQLGKRMPATVSARWSPLGTRVLLRRLGVAGLPPGAVVRVRCRGRRCPFGRRTVATPRSRSIDLLRLLRRPAREDASGQTLGVLVKAHAYNGKLVRWRLRKGHAPKAVTRCVPLGNTKQRRRC